MARRLARGDNTRMATLPNSEDLWTVREYLSTSWSPDREFVDGRIEERNLGEKEHSLIQRYLTFLFMLKRAEWDVEVFPELRTQVAATNFRVPDVLVVRKGEAFDRYLTHPPLIEDIANQRNNRITVTTSNQFLLDPEDLPFVLLQ